MARVEEGKEKLMFRVPETGQLVSQVELVVVKGDWDNQNRKYLDPPSVSSGYGACRPSWAAKMVGIKHPDADQ